jgi:hypothetical protein
MKRIKLFEAFNNGDKIKRTNLILYCWAIDLFIKENDLKPRMYKLREMPSFSKVLRSSGRIPDTQQYAFYLEKFRPDHEDYLYFRYYYYTSEDSQLYIHCMSDLNLYLPMKGIKILQINTIKEAAKQVIKKMYQDEKNKTI